MSDERKRVQLLAQPISIVCL